jgi:hypothetical protein
VSDGRASGVPQPARGADLGQALAQLGETRAQLTEAREAIVGKRRLNSELRAEVRGGTHSLYLLAASPRWRVDCQLTWGGACTQVDKLMQVSLRA